MEDQQLTCENTARAMGDAELFIKQRHVRNCYKADPAYGTGVAKALGIDLDEALKATRWLRDVLNNTKTLYAKDGIYYIKRCHLLQ